MTTDMQTVVKIRRLSSVNTETLAANKTLVVADYAMQWLDPGGADRDITLPAEAGSKNIIFLILNTADGAGEDLVVKNDTPATIATLGPGMSGMFSCDGTDWKWENESGVFYDKIGDTITPPAFQGAAAITSFSGTISAATRTATFSATADYDLCKVGSTLIADGDTRIIVALLGSDQVTVDADTTWAGATPITSLQDPISQHKDSAGNVDMYVNALGGVGLTGGNGMQKGITFGDGDTGFYEGADDVITFFANGGTVWTSSATGIGTVTGSKLVRTSPTATSPSVVPSSSDLNTGMGRAAADQLSLIAGGVEALRLIEDTTIEIRIAKNDSWLSGLNFAGAAAINMFKVNVDDEIDVGGTLVLGGSLEAAEDSGAITTFDMPVSATPAVGDEMSETRKIDGNNVFTVGAFADSAGGVTGEFVKTHGAQMVHKTDAGAANYAPSILTSDYIITTDTTAAARAVTISTEDRDSGTTDNPRIFIIKDIAGNAGANNITISLETAGTIDGAATAVINANYNSLTLVIDGTNGYII